MSLKHFLSLERSSLLGTCWALLDSPRRHFFSHYPHHSVVDYSTPITVRKSPTNRSCSVIIGVCVGLTAGLYVALNLLGAGGGRPNSAQTVQVVNALLCAIWFFSSAFGGSILNTIGPALTAFFGIIGYIIYVGSLWYFDQTGKEGFPIFAGVAIGISAGLIFVVMGYIAMSYSEEKERGTFITISINLQAIGAAVGGIIPLIINRKSATTEGVPMAVYVTFIVLMGVGCGLAFLLLPPEKVIRDDGTNIAPIHARGLLEELKGNLEAFKDWRLLIMVGR